MIDKIFQIVLLNLDFLNILEFPGLWYASFVAVVDQLVDDLWVMEVLVGYGLDVLLQVAWCECIFVEPGLLQVVVTFGLQFLVWVVEW